MIDLIAGERQFVDHLAPVWRALPVADRGRFLVTDDMLSHARGLKPLSIERASGDAPVLVASYSDVKRARRLGRTRIAFLEHGAGQSYGGRPHDDDAPCPHCHPSYPGGRDRDDVSLTLVPNRHAAERWREAYPGMTVKVIGCPKIDDLPAREPGPGPVVALSFHPNAMIGAPEADSAWRFYRRYIPVLAGKFNLIGHSHPLWAHKVRPWFGRWHVPFVEDFADVCRQADVYAIDNSSTLFEFASTGRPVVVLNSPYYKRDVDHGLRFWSAATVGVNVERWQDLIAGIREAIADPPEQRAAREAALKLVYAYRSGAAKRAVTALRAWAA